jgi:hypothetical protein
MAAAFEPGKDGQSYHTQQNVHDYGHGGALPPQQSGAQANGKGLHGKGHGHGHGDLGAHSDQCGKQTDIGNVYRAEFFLLLAAFGSCGCF